MCARGELAYRTANNGKAGIDIISFPSLLIFFSLLNPSLSLSFFASPGNMPRMKWCSSGIVSQRPREWSSLRPLSALSVRIPLLRAIVFRRIVWYLLSQFGVLSLSIYLFSMIDLVRYCSIQDPSTRIRTSSRIRKFTIPSASSLLDQSSRNTDTVWYPSGVVLMHVRASFSVCRFSC